MGKLNKVDRLAKRKLHKAVSRETASWGTLKNNAAMKGYYRDQARQQLGMPRTKSWTG